MKGEEQKQCKKALDYIKKARDLDYFAMETPWKLVKIPLFNNGQEQ